MKKSIFRKLLSGTLLAATLAMYTPLSVFASDIDGTKLAAAGKDDVILLRGNISLTDKDEKVTLSLRDSDVEQVLRMFADIAGLNILFYDPVTSKITLDLVDEPINSAFELVMELSKLSYTIMNGNTLVIANVGTDIGLVKQGITFVPVKYIDAASVAEFLNKNVFGLQKPGLSGTDIVSTHPVTNELMIFGSDNDVAIAKKIVEKFDKKPAFNTFKVNYTTPKEMADMICNMLLPTTIKDSSIGSNLLPVSSGIKIVNGGYITGGASGSSLELGAGEVACKVTPSLSTGEFSSMELQNFSISYQEQNGLINMIGGSPEQVAMVGDFIKNFDRKAPQAYLEVSVIELSETGSKSLTNTWNFYSKTFNFNTSGGSITNNNNIWVFGKKYYTWEKGTRKYYTDGEEQTVDVKVPLVWYKPGLPNFFTLQYNISYLLSNAKARTVANPRVLVTNGQESSIDITSSYVESVTTEMTASGSGNFVTRTYNIADDAGVKISVTPFISPDGYVTMDVTPEYTVIGQQMTETTYDEEGHANTYPTATLTNTRSLELKSIRIKDGETLVIGGMIMENDEKNVDKIPFLGDLPIVGALFRSTSSSRSKSEMLVMITPRIIYDDEDL
ncbi:type II secretion system protein GspD [bacterium]|nr:type II secretion system protein GspD [bacterium]